MWKMSMGSSIRLQRQAARDRGVGKSIRQIGLPQDHRFSEALWLECEPQAGGGDVATGGAEGAGRWRWRSTSSVHGTGRARCLSIF